MFTLVKALLRCQKLPYILPQKLNRCQAEIGRNKLLYEVERRSHRFDKSRCWKPGIVVLHVVAHLDKLSQELPVNPSDIQSFQTLDNRLHVSSLIALANPDRIASSIHGRDHILLEERLVGIQRAKLLKLDLEH
ncbi:hypothetical protein D3C84_750590 [compost metagenome]